MMRFTHSVALLAFVVCPSVAYTAGDLDRATALQKIEALGGSVEYSLAGKSSSIVTVSFVGCASLTNDDLKVLAAVPELNELLLAGATRISNEGLKRIVQCKKLKSLGLARTAVTDAGMVDVAKLEKLEHLQLSHTSISDKGVINLHRLPNLKSIVLNSTQVTDAGLKELSEFQSLATINVKESRVTGEGLNWLRDARPKMEVELPFEAQPDNQASNQANNQQNNPALEPQAKDTDEQRKSLARIKALDGSIQRDADGNVTDVILIGSRQLKDEDLELVKAFPEIRGLYLGRTAITGAGLKYVSGFKNLQIIGLIGTQMTDEGLKNLSKLEPLRALWLAETSISDEGIANLGRLAGLKELDLDNTKITDEALKELAHFPGLATVTMQGTKISEEALARFRAQRPNLQAGAQRAANAEIEFHPAEGDSPEMIQAAEKIKSAGGMLRRGNNQTSGPVTGIGLMGSESFEDEDLEFLKHFPELTFLVLGTKVSDKGVKRIGQCSKLQMLGLNGTWVDDECLKEIAKLKGLQRLRLSSMSITDQGLVNLNRLPNLDAIILPGTSVTDDGLKELAEFKNLRLVNVLATNVTEAGAKSLQKARPDIQVMQGTGQQAGGGGGQRSDPEFDVTVANPAYTSSHPRILFDEAHQNFHTASGRYKPLADIMRNDGYSITPGTKRFTADLLAGYQILIVANATTAQQSVRSAFAPEECTCVKEWVDAGGSLLLVTDHEPFGSASAELANQFGVEMSCKVATDPENETGNGLLFARENLQIGQHPIMQGRDASERVNRVLTFTGQSLQGPAGSWQLLRLSETAVDWNGNGQAAQPNSEFSGAKRCQGLALKAGRGRVVVMGEAAELSAQMFGDNPPQRFGMNTPGCDNRKMAMNIMHWLSHLIDTEEQ